MFTPISTTGLVRSRSILYHYFNTRSRYRYSIVWSADFCFSAGRWQEWHLWRNWSLASLYITYTHIRFAATDDLDTACSINAFCFYILPNFFLSIRSPWTPELHAPEIGSTINHQPPWCKLVACAIKLGDKHSTHHPTPNAHAVPASLVFRAPI